jgi:HAMP domain-containing protein
MKTLATTLCALLAVNFTVCAEIQRLPDLSKALPEGKLIHEVDPQIMVGYRYEYPAATDFERLKTKLKEFLGEGWKEKEVDPRMSKALERVMKVQGVELAGHATFTNPAFPEDEISLTMKKELIDGKKMRIVDLSGTWYKKAESGPGE